jgi:hypothetical protein
LSPHLLGSAFSNLTSFRVCLWALVILFLHRSLITIRSLLHLGRSPITMKPLFPFSTWVGHPLQCDHSPCFFYLDRSPIIMRPFLHLDRSPITTRPLFSFSIWVGHPLQWDHSFLFLFG